MKHCDPVVLGFHRRQISWSLARPCYLLAVVTAARKGCQGPVLSVAALQGVSGILVTPYDKAGEIAPAVLRDATWNALLTAHPLAPADPTSADDYAEVLLQRVGS